MPSKSRKLNRSEQVRILLKTSGYKPAEIAEICKCDVSLVRRLRRLARLPFDRQSLAARVAVLEVENREMWAIIRKQDERQRWVEGKLAALLSASRAGAQRLNVIRRTS